MLIGTLIVVFCSCSMFCCALLYVHSSFAIILMGLLCLVCLPAGYGFCVALLCGGMGLSAVYDCDITHLLFFKRTKAILFKKCYFSNLGDRFCLKKQSRD